MQEKTEYLHKIIARFDLLDDERLAKEIRAVKRAVEVGQIDHAVSTLLPQLHDKHKELVWNDLLLALEQALPKVEFQEVQKLIQTSPRAAAYHISDLINRRLWSPNQHERQIMKAFWSYHC